MSEFPSSTERDLTRYIEEKGIKQSAIACAIGKSKQSAQRLLSGNRKMYIGEYIAICDYLEIPYDKFLRSRSHRRMNAS